VKAARRGAENHVDVKHESGPAELGLFGGLLAGKRLPDALGETISGHRSDSLSFGPL
jgi:hypothetical protein